MKVVIALLVLMVGVAYGAETYHIDESKNIDTTGQTRTKPENILKPDCTCREIYEALKALSGIVETSDGWSTQTLEYRSPSARLREEAERMDKRDSTILKARDVISRCEKYFVERK